MKYIFTFFLFTSISFTQQVEINSVCYSVISGYTMYYQMQDRTAYGNSDPIYKEHSKKWHSLQTLETISLINVGITIGLKNQTEIVKNITDVFLVGALRWLIRDGTYNLLNGNQFFYQSENTMAQFEKYGTAVVKLSFLAIVLILKYYVFNI